jgi:hypothetical protein
MKTSIRPVLIAFALVCLALLPKVQAVVPPPDGGYPGFNTAEGQNALFNLTTGSANTAVGWYSLFTNTEGSFNTATGAGTLLFNTADANAAFGAAALLFNTTGINNTAVGAAALLHNTIAEENTATGAFALSSNTDGTSNTATGFGALASNITGSFNTANGAFALQNHTTGDGNTANGANALFNNNTGISNTAIGSVALFNNTIGDSNVAIGEQAGFNQTTGSDNIYIGQGITGVAGENNTCYIGEIFGSVSSGGTAVFINSDGKLGTLTSSARFKDNIKPMDKTSEAILSLKPVTFRYKKDIDSRGTSQFGLVAEDVEKVNPDLIVRDKEGKPYTVRYDAVNAMLLNEFLKEHRKNEEQGRDIQEQKAIIALQQKQIDALTAGLQKVSAQVEASKPAAQVVNNP